MKFSSTKDKENRIEQIIIEENGDDLQMGDELWF